MIGDRWNVTDAEVARRYPCDDLVDGVPALRAWRAVDVDAPASAVWPWLGQVRLAPYSYDWIDNLGRRSPRRLRGLPEPRVGEHFTTALGRPQGRIRHVEPGAALTGEIVGALMSYVLVPDGPRSRLLLKVVWDGARPLAPLVGLGDLVMARRQLLNLATLAESTSSGAT